MCVCTLEVPLDLALNMVHYVAYNLAKMHEKCVVHGDIKLENIMMKFSPTCPHENFNGVTVNP